MRRGMVGLNVICQTDGGLNEVLELTKKLKLRRSANPQAKDRLNAAQSRDAVNVFRIDMTFWQGKDKYCR